MKLLLLFLCTLTIACCLDNGLVLTPPMGWMHWQRFRCITDCDAYPDDCVSDTLFRTIADHMVSDGYLEAGYEYIIIDDCWSAKERDINGRLQPDPNRFPYGMKNLSDYIHNKGLKFGIYADYGTETCAGYPGSMFSLRTDAETFAEWEVDYLKLDGCNCILWPLIDLGYKAMGQYLNETGRPIVFSCSWPAYQETNGMNSDYKALAETCNLWRNWIDVQDSWASVSGIVDWFSTNQERLVPFSGPGHWNDPDMLIIGNYGLSFEQSKAQMAIWSIMAAPLIMSVDLRAIGKEFQNLLLNKEAIAINQDSLGIMGRLVLMRDDIGIWIKPLQPNDDGNPYAVAMMSYRTDGYPFRLNFTLTELNITDPSGFFVKDVFEPNNSQSVTDSELFYVRIKPTGGVLLVITPKEN